MNANVSKDGKLISGIHSLQGTEQRAGTITVRTSADDPDPVKTSTSGSGTAKSRSKHFGDKQGYQDKYFDKFGNDLLTPRFKDIESLLQDIDFETTL